MPYTSQPSSTKRQAITGFPCSSTHARADRRSSTPIARPIWPWPGLSAPSGRWIRLSHSPAAASPSPAAGPLEPLPSHHDFGHLEGDRPAMPDDLRADLHQPLTRCGHRPGFRLGGQGLPSRSDWSAACGIRVRTLASGVHWLVFAAFAVVLFVANTSDPTAAYPPLRTFKLRHSPGHSWPLDDWPAGLPGS